MMKLASCRGQRTERKAPSHGRAGGGWSRPPAFVPACCAFLALGALFVSGCATPVYEIKVIAAASAEPGGKSGSFRLITRSSSLIEKTPINQATEIARHALLRRGYSEAPAQGTPDLFIYVGCGLVAGAARIEISAIPIYVMVPGAIHYEERQVGVARDGTPIYASVAVQDPPTQRIVGYEDETRRVNTFNKFLRLVAFARDPGDGHQGVPALWGVQATFESEDASLSKILPVLTAASMVFLGQQTTGAVPIKMRDSDNDVAALRNGRR